MGYELNRIMKQYGVSTPGMANYTGAPVPTAPTAPTGSRPADDIGDAGLTDRQQVYDQQLTNYNNYIANPGIYRASSGFGGRSGGVFVPPTRPLGDRPGGTGTGAQAAYDKQLADFNAYTADPNALNEQMRKYNIDKESYDKYKTTYQDRLQNTPMYSDLQFQTVPVTSAAQTNQSAPSGNTLTPEIATSLMQRSMTTGLPYSESDKYGGYKAVKAMYDALGGSYEKPTPSTQQTTQRTMLQPLQQSTRPAASTVADLYRMYLNREPEAGIPGTAAASTRPNFIDEAQAELLYRNLGNQNLMNATGSYYGNQLKNPIYAAHGGSVHDLAAQYAIGGSVLNPPDYDEIVQGAYGTLQGRTGIGTEAGNIDQGGLDYWKSQLASGAIKPEDFRGAFIGATNQYMANNPEDKYTKYVQGYKNTQRNPADFGPPIPPDYVAPAPIPKDIANLYQSVLGRAPDAGGAAYWQNRFGNEVDADEMTLFKQAAQPEIAARIPASTPSISSGGGGSTTKDKLEKAAINAALSYIIGPTYDYANAANSLLKGDVGSTAGNLVSGLTGGISNIAKKFRFEDGGSVHDMAAKYAYGGPVKTHYQTAGPVKARYDYMSPEEEEDVLRRTPPSLAVVSPTDEVPDKQQIDMMPPVALTSVPEPRATLTNIAINNAKNASSPAPVAVVPAPVVVAPKAALPIGDERLSGIQALLATYGPKDSAYAADLKTARTTAKADSDAFARMLTSTMSSPEDAQNSKAEIYFRLAAAFGAPTKTGQFSENLGMVGKELGEFAKGKRATAREKQLLGLEVQKLKMASSKGDLDTLRALSAEEMKDKRAIATELIKEYINSGKPQSAAGKQALDEGLVAGTPAYQTRVAEIGNLNIEGKMAQIASALSGVTTQSANLTVAQSRLDLDRERLEQQKSQQAKLTGPEMKLKVDAEDTLAQTEQAMTNLKKAYSLNPNTFDGSLLDVAQRKLYEQSGSKDPKVVATRELENLLKKASLSQLKATFPGAISNDERAALDAVQGLDAKSKTERSVIMKNAFTALKSVSERHRRRLSEINQGIYRDTAPIEEGDK